MARHPLAENARSLPQEPGVYTFLSDEGSALYVGKAQSLRDRVSSYFSGSQPPRIAHMLEQAKDIEVVLVSSDPEAYLLESSLIRERRPRYNVMLTDDKRYPWILVSAEPHPRVAIVRTQDERGTYFGPFPDAGSARALVNVLREAFGIRDCERELPRGCIKHDLGLCLAPCFRPIEEEYASAVASARRVLSGTSGPALDVLRTRMERASADLEYERAARLRDRIRSVEALLGKQAIFATSREDVDAIALETRGERSVAVVLPRRGGRVVDAETFEVPGGSSEDRPRLLAEFIARYYEHRAALPHEVLVQFAPEGALDLERDLSARGARRVRVRTSVRGTAARLVRLAEKNAQYQLARAERRRGPDPGVADLARHLALPQLPMRIECIDVSHHGGSEVVASLVTFSDGRPDRRGYRKFKLSQDRNDDVAAIHEVVRRRLSRLAKEGAELPDLLVVDGGRGQVDAARRASDELGLPVTILGLAKRQEEVWRPGWSAPVRLSPTSQGLQMLQRARDEAHRVAITFGRKRRERALTASVLETVPGVGPAIRKRLLTRFGSVEGVENAALDELCDVKGVGPALARRLKAVLESSDKV